MNQRNWTIEALGIQKLWHDGLDGRGVLVGHLDTGVDGSHPGLNGRIATFQQFDKNGFLVKGAPIQDSQFHGTQTASIICGGVWQGTPLGVAPQAELVSGQVIEGGNVIVRLLMGLDWVLTTGVRVVSLSLGIPGLNPIFSAMVRLLQQRGILCIAPIGNTGAGRSYAPGNYDNVLSVGAIGSNGRVPSFSGSLNSSLGKVCRKPDIVAPGVDVPAFLPNGGLTKAAGTSMASAYVAGVAALLFQAFPQATGQRIAIALLNTTAVLPTAQDHRVNCGLVNPLGALAFLEKKQMDTDNCLTLGRVPYPKTAETEQKYIDKRLRLKMAYADDSDKIEAILQFKEHDKGQQGKNCCLQEIINRVGGRLHESPDQLRLLPEANTAIILASKKYVTTLIEQTAIATACAPDISKGIVFD